MDFVIQSIFAFLGTLSFALIFETPKKHYLLCSLIGMIGWMIYLLTLHFSVSKVFATFIASLVLSFLATLSSYVRKAPTTIFLICGIFTLVPGIGLYNVAYEFFLGKDGIAGSAGYVLKVTLAIAFGIVIANTVTSYFVLLHRKRKQRRISRK